jgi:hypothetical protein
LAQPSNRPILELTLLFTFGAANTASTAAAASTTMLYKISSYNASMKYKVSLDISYELLTIIMMISLITMITVIRVMSEITNISRSKIELNGCKLFV